jgi:hypothetical protein
MLTHLKTHSLTCIEDYSLRGRELVVGLALKQRKGTTKSQE